MIKMFRSTLDDPGCFVFTYLESAGIGRQQMFAREVEVDRVGAQAGADVVQRRHRLSARRSAACGKASAEPEKIGEAAVR